jgi:receptor protein-tyrosine kinase
MTAGSRSTHLVERAAPFLRSDAGLGPVSGPKPARTEAGWIAAGWDPDHSAIAPPPAQSGSPCLAVEALHKVGLVLTGRERTRNSEEYRIATGRILRGLRGIRNGPEPANLLMVTSARPGEGKSFTALNIAASIAMNELGEVLLVDIDAKSLSTTARLGLAGAPGLLNLAVNPILRLEDALIRTAIGGLSYLPIGTRDAAATEPGVTRSVSATLERIKRRFARHLVLLDCAPCLSTSDPSTLASLVDQVVMVVEAERTQRNEVESSLDLIKACPNIILLLNKVRLTSSSTFGAYYSGDSGSSASEH